eukprot:6951316-Prymnesium_polylepis.2
MAGRLTATAHCGCSARVQPSRPTQKRSPSDSAMGPTKATYSSDTRCAHRSTRCQLPSRIAFASMSRPSPRQAPTHGPEKFTGAAGQGEYTRHMYEKPTLWLPNVNGAKASDSAAASSWYAVPRADRTVRLPATTSSKRTAMDAVTLRDSPAPLNTITVTAASLPFSRAPPTGSSSTLRRLERGALVHKPAWHSVMS